MTTNHHICAKYRDFTVYETQIVDDDNNLQTIYYTYIDGEHVDSTEPNVIRQRIDDWFGPSCPPSWDD